MTFAGFHGILVLTIKYFRSAEKGKPAERLGRKAIEPKSRKREGSQLPVEIPVLNPLYRTGFFLELAAFPEKDGKEMMTVKAIKRILIVTVVFGQLFFLNTAYAMSTTQTIHLTFRVVGSLSLRVDEEWIDSGNSELSAEAYSVLSDQDVQVNQTQRGDATVWIFTKTE